MKFLTIFFFAVFCFACATTSKFDEKCKSYLGRTESDLIADWGNPYKTSTTNDKKHLEYEVDPSFTGEPRKFSTIGGGAGQYDIAGHECNVVFTIIDDLVASYSYLGDRCKYR